jgi:hypothetical protein
MAMMMVPVKEKLKGLLRLPLESFVGKGLRV